VSSQSVGYPSTSDKAKIRRALEFVSDIRSQKLSEDNDNVIYANGNTYHFDETDALIFIEEG
jgi:hypothetical protein